MSGNAGLKGSGASETGIVFSESSPSVRSARDHSTLFRSGTCLLVFYLVTKSRLRFLIVLGYADFPCALPWTDSWEEPQDISAKFGCSVAVGEHSFAQMEEDVDRQKLLGQPSHQRIGHPTTDIDHLTLQVQVNLWTFIVLYLGQRTYYTSTIYSRHWPLPNLNNCYSAQKRRNLCWLQANWLFQALSSR